MCEIETVMTCILAQKLYALLDLFSFAPIIVNYSLKLFYFVTSYYHNHSLLNDLYVIMCIKIGIPLNVETTISAISNQLQ